MSLVSPVAKEVTNASSSANLLSSLSSCCSIESNKLCSSLSADFSALKLESMSPPIASASASTSTPSFSAESSLFWSSCSCELGGERCRRTHTIDQKWSSDHLLAGEEAHQRRYSSTAPTFNLILSVTLPFSSARAPNPKCAEDDAVEKTCRVGPVPLVSVKPNDL